MRHVTVMPCALFYCPNVISSVLKNIENVNSWAQLQVTVHCEKYVALKLKCLNLVFSYIYIYIYIYIEKKIFRNLVTKIHLFAGIYN